MLVPTLDAVDRSHCLCATTSVRRSTPPAVPGVVEMATTHLSTSTGEVAFSPLSAVSWLATWSQDDACCSFLPWTGLDGYELDCD